MIRHSTRWRMMVVMLLVVLGYGGASSGAGGASSSVGIPPETVADYIHAVIEADRTFYTLQVVERMQNKGVVTASEHWRVKDTLPLPAQFLLESARLSELTGAHFQYRLIGLAPINPLNGPATDFERKGLEDVQKNPERPYRGINPVGGERHFEAVYADRAISQACVACHNAHPNSSKRDYKFQDVMGGIVISIPLEK